MRISDWSSDVCSSDLLRLLRRIAEGVDHRPDHRDAKRHQRRRIGGGAFLVEDIALHSRPAWAAILGRPVRRAPAPSMQDEMPGYVVRLEIGRATGRESGNAGVLISGVAQTKKQKNKRNK